MPILAAEGESKPKQQPPAGTHVARCISVIDLGTQPTPFGDAHKISVTWELPNEQAVFSQEKGEQPFVIAKDYTLSLYEKANLRHDLESWRGRQFTDTELKGFDVAKLIGVPAMLSVVHKTTQKGKTYANVAGVSAMPKGMVCPPQINPSVEYSIRDGENDVFDSLPEWLQKKIKSAQEWNGNGAGSQAIDEDLDEIPFS